MTRSTIPPASHVGVSGLPRDEFVDSDLLGHSVVVPEDLEDEHPRTRPACLIRPFNISDREVGDYISDRPRFTTHISETDLAPRRRSSAAPPPEREADGGLSRKSKQVKLLSVPWCSVLPFVLWYPEKSLDGVLRWRYSITITN